MEIYSAAECQQRNITGYLICGELQPQHKERCKQKHVCISDNNTTTNNKMDVQRAWTGRRIHRTEFKVGSA